MSKPDRRIQRTHDALRRAMVELIIERGFEATNVSEIADRANVGRSTFYAHYADKEDLLQASLEELRRWLEGRVQEGVATPRTDVHPALVFCLPMLEHADEQRELFAALVGRRSGTLVTEYMHDIWADIVRARWATDDELAVQAIVGAFGAAVSWWLERAPELTPAEVDARFRAVAEPAVAGPRRKPTRK